jgi:hypothetical protein
MFYLLKKDREWADARSAPQHDWVYIYKEWAQAIDVSSRRSRPSGYVTSSIDHITRSLVRTQR